MKELITTKKLNQIRYALSDRDIEILSALQQCRFLMPHQIRRLYFHTALNEKSGIRAVERNLKKLKELKLINALERKIGGVRAGSSAYIWNLTEAGYRLLCLDQPDKFRRKRFFEPSEAHLAHTLAIAECWVQLVEIFRRHPESEFTHVRFEPECWRYYPEHGKGRKLQPDLFAITEDQTYEYRWFIEIDLGTEDARFLMNKCEIYHQYYLSGKEQQEGKVFPMVVWLVKNQSRKDRLIEIIKTAYKDRNHLFVVITPDELEDLIIYGAKKDQII